MAGVRANLDSIKRAVNQSASDAVGDGLRQFCKELLSSIPTNRTKTRKAVRVIHQNGELSGLAGVMFAASNQYPTRGTKTREIVRQCWADSETDVVDAVVNSLAEGFRGIDAITITIESKG